MSAAPYKCQFSSCGWTLLRGTHARKIRHFGKFYSSITSTYHTVLIGFIFIVDNQIIYPEFPLICYRNLVVSITVCGINNAAVLQYNIVLYYLTAAA
jgi:hypothetical protein